ncbi:MAG: response regulator transcription factor [Anaerolineae bacterium]|jgi:DNA-binding NarL/FixJ family response regulator|nr:response regulator transcription factor [Anaerolineae bacterium]MBT3712944.1 response regulator transcription factor [Anaerolineae bacterium]MBT4309451.1 response regulator transcription factor [Anaerolineae bacterium]MBT4458273.1 response regulator transcription factor [Anaerolineae bacterium]MBT4840972.1 response regulator transcription factor [Anaerolineae bacterium]
MEKIKLVVVDDHPLFRQGVVDALSLEPDMTVIGQASSGEEALEMIQALAPDVAVLDVNLPGMNGQQITHRVVQKKLKTRILLLTGYDDLEQALHAALAGAAAYCAKEIGPKRLIESIREIYQGKYVVAEQVFSREELDVWIKSHMADINRTYSEPGTPFHPLSKREMEVLSCVVRGMSNKEIALLLGISHQTVKNHVTAILRKFGVEDRTQAVVYALKRGWVQLHDDEQDA